MSGSSVQTLICLGGKSGQVEVGPKGHSATGIWVERLGKRHCGNFGLQKKTLPFLPIFLVDYWVEIPGKLFRFFLSIRLSYILYRD